MASGGRLSVLVAAALSGVGCAHGPGVAAADHPILSAGQYHVESIRSRAALDGADRLVEISESGTRLVDASGTEHVLTERGALTLGSGGSCRLALAISVDGEEPGVSDRSCTWELRDDVFVLGDTHQGGARTAYRVRKVGDRFVLEGLRDLGATGESIGDASGERIVLLRGPGRVPQPLDRVTEQSRHSDGPELTHEL
ncbi:MAG TPA: hypothetical protein VE620_12265 [Myxococcales bacterium]|jgi:hypothetical protein|nr:hypothetical protein [Myxococcales bacterium]